MPTSSLIPVLSLVIAALAVFFGPLVTLRISRKQTELSRRIASKQIVAPMRQAWINDLRDKLAELLGSALYYAAAGTEYSTDKQYMRLETLQEQIILRINPHEPDHQNLIASIKQMVNAIERIDSPEFIKAHTRTTELAQKIFKTEWNRIKDDIEQP